MQNKKRITFFDATLREGGAERVISLLSNALVNEYEVSILLYYNDDIFYKINENINIVCVEKQTNSKNIIKNISFIKKYFKNNSDLIISFLAPFNMLALLANKNNNIPIIVADRNDPRYIPTNSLIRNIRNYMYEKYADCIVVQTLNNKNYFNDKTKHKIKIIENPVDIKELAGKAITTEKTKKIVSVGRLVPQKNQKMLINAFKIFHNSNCDYKLEIYGEGELRKELEKFIDDLGMSDCVFLLGNDKNVHSRILDANLFVLSSNYEGMPNSLIEAMCLGLPVISTKVSGANELIKDGHNGLLVNINDVDELTKKMQDLVNNEEKSACIAKNAIELNATLSVNNIINKWIDIIINELK